MLIKNKTINKKNKKIIKEIKLELEYPEKFKEIINISENRRTVIYSNYYKAGLESFKKFIDEINIYRVKNKKNKITYFYLDNKIKKDNILLQNIIYKFKNNEINFLLLCPQMIEGINIMKVQDFHFLEPLGEYNKIQQIISRAIRYNSHIELEGKERYLNIYIWVTHTLSSIKNFFSKFKYWKKYGKSRIYWERFHNFDQDITPDSITYKILKNQEKHIKELENVIKKNNIFSTYKYLFN